MTSLTAVDWINRKSQGLTAVVRLDQIDGEADALLRRKIWIDHRRYFVMAVESTGLIWPGKVEDEVALTVRALL